MINKLQQLLEHLEETINPKRISDLEQLHISALNFEDVHRLPVIACFDYPNDEKFIPFDYSQAFEDPEKMLFNQLVYAYGSSYYLSEFVGDDLPITIRADLGCVLVASMFGANVEQIENNPPWIRQNTDISYDQVINTCPFDFKGGFIQKAFNMYECFENILADYPNLASFTNIVLPDLQGPIDNLELIIGSRIFEDMYLKRDQLLNAMDVVTDAQIELTKYFKRFVNRRFETIGFQHSFAQKGDVLIRNDTAIMVSPEMYNELIAPFDRKILQCFEGGIHSCGDVNRIASQFLLLEENQFFDFGQSELNDIDTIYEFASEKRKPLIRIAVNGQQLLSKDLMKKFPTGCSLIFRASSVDNAKEIIDKYKSIYGE